MAILRTDIIRALDELVNLEAGTAFQALAIVLAKQKWPDLIASEWHNDGGLDAYAPSALGDGRPARGLASSLSITVTKVVGDATTAKQNYPDLGVLIFMTPKKVTAETAKNWKKRVFDDTGIDLYVVSREDIITSLMLPSNLPLCRTLPGINVPTEPTDVPIVERVRAAVAKEAANWRVRQRVINRPVIPLLATKLDGAGKETSDAFDYAALRTALLESRRISLEAPGGGGKTTTLVQLATDSARDGDLVFLVDLPAWIRGGVNILEFIARSPSFLAEGVTPAEIAKLATSHHISFLLNGWNEIADVHSESAAMALSELDRNFPAAGIIIATRTHHLILPLPGAIRCRLAPLTRRQRASYLKQVLGDRADELRIQLDGNRVLDDLTRSPFILGEVATIFQSGNSIPDSRIGVLAAVTKIIEATPEHALYLRTAPLSDHAGKYLTQLAAAMTSRGEVLISAADARVVIHGAASMLRDSQQIVNIPDPDAVLHALCAHHVLERVDYPEPSFRFQHQQFQEFYAARFLSGELDALRHADAAASKDFAASYINLPMWEEPLRMVAEQIRLYCDNASSRDAAIENGTALVTMALGIAPIFASDLSRLCGSAVWASVGGEVGKTLRAWFAIDEPHHRRLATAAMLATGSVDFSDVLLPLLTNADRQVRVSTYDASDAFYPESLGVKWRETVANWNEGARADFVSEVTHRGYMADVGEHFAINDPSEKVRREAISGLVWISASDALARVATALDDTKFEAALPSFHADALPAAVWSRMAAAYRRIAGNTADPVNRIRALLQANEYGDTDIAGGLKTALSELKAPVDQYAPHAIMEVLKIIGTSDTAWVNAWVAARLLDGTLWGEHWHQFLGPPSEQQAADILKSLEAHDTRYRDFSAARAIISREPTAPVAALVFRQLLDMEASVLAGADRQTAWQQAQQLRELLRDMPPNAMVGAMSEGIAKPFDVNTFKAITDVLGQVNADAEDLRSELSEPLRQSLRYYLKAGIEKALTEDLLNDEIRSHAAMSLGRVGDPEDIAELRRLIEADIGRHHTACGGTSYSNWFVRAVLLLGANNADLLMIDLLRELRYQEDASGALVQLAVAADPRDPLFRNTIDFDAVWAARARKIAPESGPAKRFAKALIHRIEELKQEDAGKNQNAGRIKGLAIRLAVLDGRESADIVIGALAPPGRWDAYARMNGIQMLVRSGAVISYDSMAAVLDPAIEHTIAQGVHQEQNMTLLIDCLELLPFSDDPARAIARIDEIVAQFKFRPYQIRDLIKAIGFTRCEAAVPFLLRLATGKGSLQHMEIEWIDAMARLNTPSARDVLVNFVDPKTPPVDGINLDFRNEERLGAHIAQFARQFPELRQRLLDLSNGPLNLLQRRLLPAVYHGLGDDSALVAGVNLMKGNLSPIFREAGLESQFLQREPSGATSSFQFVPCDARRARAELFRAILDDPSRRSAAFATLGQVEVWRQEYGRPISEPRHPLIEAGVPWPPLALVTSMGKSEP